MSATTNSLFTDEHLEALNRLACKVLLQAKEMVDYVEESGMSEGHNLEFLESVTQATKIALSKLSKTRERDGEDDGLWDACSFEKAHICMILESESSRWRVRETAFSQGIWAKNKLTLSDLLAVINNKIMALYGTHWEEEDTAIARLNRGYSRFSLEEITRKLQTSTQQAANWRQQIKWDKGVDGAVGTENRIEEREKYLIQVNNALAPMHMIGIILDTMVQIKLAADWVKKDAKWIKQYNNRMFDLRRAEEVKNAKALLSEGLFRKWKGAERRKYAERVSKENNARVWTMKLYLEYGSIVLLDPLWNPIAFGCGNRTADFASYMSYQLQKPLLKRATPEEIARYPGKAVDNEGSKWIPWHYGNKDNNDYVLLELMQFMTGDDTIVTHIEEFLAGDPMATE
ncbi:hypothetical protein BDN71DRAFT_1434506 [Pleurotus eryngii]|uniref:Uncharacterized protein n=1 Tax=Pleurotus eryngii TaxID=5323 RepID=A0A9P5ZLZ7_PLEER|nr:hypothetical protein BDN71DRAFT_1434506 [Pleurotus eryngii]